MPITRIIDDICLHKALIFPPHSLHSGYSHLIYVYVYTYSTSDLSRPTCMYNQSHEVGCCIINHGLHLRFHSHIKTYIYRPA